MQPIVAWRAMQELLKDKEDTPQVFVMQHRRAEDVAGRVLTMLGLSPAGIVSPQGVQLSYQGMNLFVTVASKSNSFRVNAHREK